MLNHQVAANPRIPFTVNWIFTGLGPGTYAFGMCARSATPSNWNLNEDGYASGFVFN